MEKELRELFFKYIDKIHSIKTESSQKSFEYLIENYLTQFNQFFKIYNKSDDLKEVYVYRDKDYKNCRIILCAETKKNMVKYSVKQLKESKEPIFFTKNCIVIQKPINIFNFSIIQGIVDYGEITEAIFKAEINHISF